VDGAVNTIGDFDGPASMTRTTIRTCGELAFLISGTPTKVMRVWIPFTT
jgi:hypothetical protein